MRKIKVGNFCGYDLVLEVNDINTETDEKWIKRWERYLEQKKESEDTIKWMEKEINKKKENLQIILK